MSVFKITNERSPTSSICYQHRAMASACSPTSHPSTSSLARPYSPSTIYPSLVTPWSLKSSPHMWVETSTPQTKARLSLISYIRVQMPSLSISASLHSPLHADALSFMVSTKWVSSGLDYSACLSPCGTHEGCWLDEEAFCFKPSCLSTYHFGHTDPSWRSCISYISSGTEQVLKLGHVRLPRPPSPFYPSSFLFHDFRRSYSFFHCSMDLVSWGVVCHPLLSWTASHPLLKACDDSKRLPPSLTP